MANFKLFEPILLKQEGGWSDVPGDSGGPTWEGISQNNYPKWGGWNIIQYHRNNSVNQNAFIIALHSDSALQVLVDKFYKCNEWDTINGDEITNQSIANFICDFEVNAGKSESIKCVQKILNLTVDGKVGPKTLAGINANSNQQFFDKLKAARKQFYFDIVKAHPSDKKFLNGWLIRTDSFNFVP